MPFVCVEEGDSEMKSQRNKERRDKRHFIVYNRFISFHFHSLSPFFSSTPSTMTTTLNNTTNHFSFLSFLKVVIPFHFYYFFFSSSLLLFLPFSSPIFLSLTQSCFIHPCWTTSQQIFLISIHFTPESIRLVRWHAHAGMRTLLLLWKELRVSSPSLVICIQIWCNPSSCLPSSLVYFRRFPRDMLPFSLSIWLPVSVFFPFSPTLGWMVREGETDGRRRKRWERRRMHQP